MIWTSDADALRKLRAPSYFRGLWVPLRAVSLLHLAPPLPMKSTYRVRVLRIHTSLIMRIPRGFLWGKGLAIKVFPPPAPQAQDKRALSGILVATLPKLNALNLVAQIRVPILASNNALEAPLIYYVSWRYLSQNGGFWDILAWQTTHWPRLRNLVFPHWQILCILLTYLQIFLFKYLII